MTTSKGLVLNIDFAEKSGAVAGDATRYGNDGALNGCKWVERGLEFNGVDDYVDCGNDASLNPRHSISVAASVKRNSIGSSQVIAAKMETAAVNIAYWLGFDSGNTFTFYVSQDGSFTTREYFTTTNTFTSKTDWYNVVGTFDSTDIHIYVDGVDEAGTTAGAATSIYNSPADLKIGARFATPELFLNGSIDQVRIYNRVLNTSEIKEYYEATKHKYR